MRQLFIILSFCLMSAPVLAQSKFTVVLDPGHGGFDPGATKNGVYEKNVVLAIAKLVGKQIANDKDINVVYTRNSDVFVPLYKRARIAIDAKADLFISIHSNSFQNTSVKGTETFVLGMHKSKENLEIAKKENSVILIEDDFELHYEGFDPNSSESYIIFDLMQEEYLSQSIELASYIEANFKDKANRRSRGVKQAGFLVLKETSAPSVLIETGYLTNPAEAAYLKSKTGQTAIAQSIAEAIIKYKSRNNALNLAENTKNTEYSPTNSSSSPKLYYSVQLLAAKEGSKISDQLYKNLDGVYQTSDGNTLRYFYKKAESYAEALKNRTEAQKYFKDAFIKAFYDGKYITNDKAKKLEEQLKDK